MRVLVTGSGGMLAHDILPLLSLSHEIIALDKEKFDITNPLLVRETIGRLRPECVINCAAYTKVDKCEVERELAFRVNAIGPKNLAEACKKANALLIHFGTDYIFDGKKGQPYLEEDAPHPLNVYGASKLEGESYILSSGVEYLILRSQWLYGPGGHHFVRTITRLALDLLRKGEENPVLKVVSDQWGSPTYTADLARAVKSLLERKARGIYHVTNCGSCSWKEFAEKILEFQGLRLVSVQGIESSHAGRPALRPSYSVLSNAKLMRDFHFTLPLWDEALQRFLAEHPDL